MKKFVRQIEWEPDTINKSTNSVPSKCADITFVNNSWDGTLPIVLGTNTDDVMIDGTLVRFGQSYTDTCYGEEYNNKNYSIKFITTNAPLVSIRRKKYVGWKEIDTPNK